MKSIRTILELCRRTASTTDRNAERLRNQLNAQFNSKFLKTAALDMNQYAFHLLKATIDSYSMENDVSNRSLEKIKTNFTSVHVSNLKQIYMADEKSQILETFATECNGYYKANDYRQIYTSISKIYSDAILILIKKKDWKGAKDLLLNMMFGDRMRIVSTNFVKMSFPKQCMLPYPEPKVIVPLLDRFASTNEIHDAFILTGHKSMTTPFYKQFVKFYINAGHYEVLNY